MRLDGDPRRSKTTMHNMSNMYTTGRLEATSREYNLTTHEGIDLTTNDPCKPLRPSAVPGSDNDLPEVMNMSMRNNSESEQLSVFAASRVMSPTYPTDPSSMMLQGNRSLLLGLECRCQACNVMTPDPSLCANCGNWGHPICLGMEQFQGYAFCNRCMGGMVRQYATMNDTRLRQEWQNTLSHKVFSWRERARDAIGTSASIGIAVGGVAATAAGAVFAVAQGIVQGASGAAAGGSVSAEVEPPPPSDSTFYRRLDIRRSNSTGDLSEQLVETCDKCLGNARARHTYRGTCRGLPASVYFKSKNSATIADAPSTQAASSTEQARRAEGQTAMSTERQVETAEQELDRLLAQTRSEPRAMTPPSPQKLLVPPSSFGSANSLANQSFYGVKAGGPPGSPALEAGALTLVESPPVLPDSDLKQLLFKAIASNEELGRAVSELQVSVSNLEIKVADLQVQLLYYESNEDSTRYYDLSTPRLGAEPATLAGWYDGREEAMPSRVQDLAAQSETPGLANSSHFGLNAAEIGLSRNAQGQLAAESPSQPRTDAMSGRQEASAAESGQYVTEVLGRNQQLVPLPTDSDVFSFLAGTQPTHSSVPYGPTGVHDPGRAQPFVPPVQFGCQTPSLPQGREEVSAPPGLAGAIASPPTITQQELGMIMKAIQTYLSDMPKLELGDMATRATRLHSWKTAIHQALLPVGSHMRNWWNWCLQKAGVAYKRFLSAELCDREKIFPQDLMPSAWEQIDSWMRPKLLDSVPSVVREWVNMRARQGKIDDTHVILFWVVKQFGPGSADEQVAINGNILNPHVCSHPRAAQLELMKWKENIRRLAELNISPPALLLTYRAMESIFSVVFDKAEPQLNARWISMKNNLGLPHRVDHNAIETVAAFADSELGALVLAGNSSLNPGMPLTDNQKSRNNQLKEADKKRAAAAKAQASPPPPPVQADATAAAMFRKSATTSMWAPPCKDWQGTGVCTRGMSCKFAHAGFLVSEKRCIICGKGDHGFKDCTAPGGAKDPNREATIAEYRKRKEANKPAEGKGKGQDREAKGEGKGKKGKGKGKKGDKGSQAKAALDLEIPRASAAVTPTSFPRHCIGLDSWANVHLIHKKTHKGSSPLTDTLTLAHGSCKCSREVGPKGVPRVLVPQDSEADNIDLFPEGFLYERGCTIMRGEQHTLTTPTGRVVEIKMWGSLPYISKEDLHKVIGDLPDHTVPGRSGGIVQVPTAARVCRNTISSGETRSQLKHLLSDMQKPQFNNVCSKYRNLPDAYYGGDTAQFVSPDKLEDHLSLLSGNADVVTNDVVPNVKIWEWYSGSSSLSKNSKQSEIPHHPPVDYRYGWNLSKSEHQLKLLSCLLTRGTDCLFASPNCAPWGNDSRAAPAQRREERRELETNTLTFLAVACIFQILLDRKYIVENSAYSDIFAKSPLQVLREGTFHLALFYQCTCGPTLNSEFVRKRSHFQGSHVFHHLQKLCPGGHKHLQLRGGGRAASSALYPDPECALILLDAQLPSDACEGGRNLLCDGTPVSAFVQMSWNGKIKTLKSLAHKKGMQSIWDKAIQPWLKANGANGTRDEVSQASLAITEPVAAPAVPVVAPVVPVVAPAVPIVAPAVPVGRQHGGAPGHRPAQFQLRVPLVCLGRPLVEEGVVVL